MQTTRMSKVRVICAQSQVRTIIDKLYELGALHITPHTKDESFDIGSSLDNIEKISELLVKIRSIKSQFKITHQAVKQTYSLDEIETKLAKIRQEIENHEQKITAISQRLDDKNELLKQLDFLNSLYLDIDSYQPLKSVTSFIGHISHREELRDQLNAITNRFKLHISKNGKERTMALFVENRAAPKVAELLRTYSYKEFDISRATQRTGPVMQNCNQIIDQITALEVEKEQQQNSLRFYLNKHKAFFANTEEYLNQEAEKAGVPLTFARSKNCFIITGFVPQDELVRTRLELEKVSDAKIVLDEKEILEQDKVPIEMTHAPPVKPFEFFMHLYTLPSYRELDPTLFMFITFPLFFGLMLGDVGYGVVTLIVFMLLKRAIPAAKNLLSIMMYSSISTIFFGLIFGEYFGFEHVKESTANVFANFGIHLHPHTIVHHGEQMLVYEFPRLFNRLHGSIEIFGNSIHAILVIGAIIGFIHLNLGLLIGFANEWKHHGFAAAFLHKISWMVMQAAVILLVITALKIISLPMWVGWIALVISIIMIYKGEGVQGLVELPAIFSNMLSYMRLGAVGLASVGLAIVVNENLTIPIIQKGGAFIILGILVFTLGHIINILLGIIGPFLHSLRLHYVEFFSKFYKGGGVAYAPFGAKNTTEEE